MNKKYPLIIKYRVTEDDSEYMSSDTREDEAWDVELSSKQELIEFLKSREMVFVNDEIIKDLERTELVFSDEMNYDFDHRDSPGNWVSTDYYLTIKSKVV